MVHDRGAAPSPSGPIERLGPDDLTYLATGPSSSNLGVVLELAGPAPPLDALVAALAPRVAAVPRLRQRIRRVPRGAGRPIWVDDPDFDIHQHVTVRRHPGEVDGDVLASIAATAVAERLPPTRPLWTMTLVTGRDPAGACGLVVVVHHVLTDGVGGLAVLAALADPAAAASADRAPTLAGQAAAPAGDATRPFPRPAPTLAELRDDARRRWHPRPARLRTVVTTLRAVLTSLRAGWRELWPTRDGGPGREPQGAARRTRALAPSCALNAPTGPRRAAALTRVELEDVRAIGRSVGATVNDVVLAAITGALASYLAAREQHPSHLVASVPVSRRERTGAGELGNAAGVMPVVLPVGEADPVVRLQRIAVQTAGHRGSERGASLALLRPVFRALTTLGLWGWMVDRQRMVNVFVTNLRGPATSLRLGGLPVTGLIPFGTPAGNVAVTFAVLSYAGTLTITVVVDPDVVPDPGPIAGAITRELAALARQLDPVEGRSGPGVVPGR